MMRYSKRSLYAIAALLIVSATASADVVIDWNRIMLATASGQNPFAQARTAAVTQLAVFEAVNACTRAYEPYLGTVLAPFGASAEAAAVAAAHGVLKSYFPAAAASLDAQRAASLAAIPDGQAKADGIAVGEAAARAMILARANDGATPAETFLPATADPGVWQPTPPGFGPGTLFHWRNLALFGLERNDQFRSDPPPELTSGRYTTAYREVMAVGRVDSDSRPQDRTDVARFFAAASAVYAWNVAVEQVSGASYAARRVAERLLHGKPVGFTLTHPALPNVTLAYASFRQLTDDIDDARVYGGIHFRFDQEAGGRQGRRVGKYIYDHHLVPVPVRRQTARSSGTLAREK
jgi:hypothetical protein